MTSNNVTNKKNRSLCLRWRIALSLLFVFCSQFAWSQCTNCTTSTVGGNTIHIFTSGSGTFTPPASVSSVDYLVVGGGGGGGAGDNTVFFGTYNHGGGGGGAGGLLSGAFSVSATTYNIAVGNGGTAGIDATGGDGGSSSFTTFTAVGGGGGGVYGENGRAGGSGGGGGGQGTGGSGSQGNLGGNGHNTFFQNRGGGGGGGAGNAGGNGSDDAGGTGGAGVASSHSGTSVTYARGGNGGGTGLPGNNGVAGTANTGNGGGGGWSSAGNGAAGGSGIVIIRYPTPATNYYSRATGNWSATSTWSTAACNGAAASSIPHSTATVYVCPGHAVTLNTNATINRLEFVAGTTASLTHSGASALTVGAGGVLINGINSGTGTNAWSINAGTATVNGTLQINGGGNDSRQSAVNITTGTLDINGDLTYGSNPTRTSVTATGTAQIFLSGSLNIPNGSGRLLPGTASTFTYDGTGTQTALLGVSNIDYHHLVFAGSGTKNQTTWSSGRAIGGNTTVNNGVTFNNSASLSYQGSFTNNGTTDASAAQIYNGNFVNNNVYTASAQQQYRLNFTNTGTFNSGASSHTFVGSVTQQITGATSFQVMALDNIAGLTLNNDITVQSQITLTNGAITTNANVLRVAQAGGWSGINRTNGWIAGNLGLWFPTGSQSRIFPIGGGSIYRPLTISAGNFTVAGYLVAAISQSAGDHSQLGTSSLDAAQSVNRFWSITSEGAATADYAATFAFDATDLDGGTDTNALVIQRWDTSTWTDVTVGTRTATSTQGTAISGFGEFAIAEPAVVAVPVAVAEYRMEEDSWNGTAGEVIDSSGGGLHGTAAGGTTTANILPAVAGSPGTCRYGEFDGGDDYIDAGNISATLNATASLAFWIRTTQTGNDTGWQAPGIAGVEQSGGADDIFWGWIDASGRIGVSVANTFTTKSSTAINDDVWHHVVLTRDHVAGTFKIYIDGNLNANGAIAAGVIGTSYSSIGRIEDTGGSPEYFDGLLDEVRIYDSVLTDGEVLAVMADTHLCNATLCPGETPQGGLIGSYYNSINLSGGVTGSRVDGPVNFNWGGGSPGVSGIGSDQFSVQWNGYIRATETGDFFFRTLSDDGVRLYVDGNAVISNWTNHAVTTNTSAAVTLTAGQIYPVVLEFFENGGQAEIRLQWQTPSGGSFVAIPAGPAVLDAGLYSCANNSVGYYEISHSGTGLTCEAEAITISAFNGSGVSMNPANGTTIVLATTPNTGTWSSSNSFTFDGSTSSAVRYLRQTTPATLNINVSDGSASEIASADPDITFTDVGIRFYGNTAASPLPNQIAGVADPNTVLRVVETSSDTGACVARIQNTNRDVALAYECRNPSACSAGQTMSLNGASVQSNNNGASINYSTVNLSFDANGFAAIPLQYSDVGTVRLHSQLVLPVEGDDPAITITGSSSEFVVKPASLALISTQSSGGSPNPGTQGGGAGFIAAGGAFEVRVEGRNALGARTPAFGRENSPENIQVNIANLIFPSGGSVGALANTNAFVPDVATPGVYENNSLSWSEVGSITLSPSLSDGDYLGAGAVPGIESNTVGRFFPADFSLASSAVVNSCDAGGFSYLSDPSVTVAYQILAHNSGGGVVNNYDNTDLTYPAASVIYHAENNNNGSDLASRLTIATTSWNDGVATVNDTASVFNRALAGSNVIVDGPFASLVVGLELNDIDDANFSTLDFKPGDSNNCVVDADCDSKLLSGLLNLRFGRLHVSDGHGPESAAIPMRWQTEYWDGSQFIINSNDQCTQLPLANVNFVGATNTVDAVNDRITVDIGGISSVFNFSDPLGSDNCLSATAIGFCDGRAGIEYGAPGSIVAYPIDIDLSTLNFLQGDWNQDGSYDDASHPRVTIRFQHYRGHDRVIFWREVLN